MLKFGQNALDWADIASFTIAGEDTFEVIVTTTDNVNHCVKVCETSAAATAILALCEAGKQAYIVGGVLIEVIIDDL